MITKFSRIENTVTHDADCASLSDTHTVQIIIDPATRYIVSFQLVEKATGGVVNGITPNPTFPLHAIALSELTSKPVIEKLFISVRPRVFK